MNTIDPNINYPENIRKVITGRATTDTWLKNNYPRFYKYIMEKYVNGLTINEKIYMFYNNIIDRPVCKTCGKPVKFFGYSKGFGQHCCAKCTQADKKVRDKYKDSCTYIYGENFYNEFNKKGKQTKKEKYGDENYNNLNKMKTTCLERYGVENAMMSKEIQNRGKQTCLERYGVENYMLSEEFRKNLSMYLDKSRQTCLERYGVENVTQHPEIKAKISNVCQEKYGCKWNCMRPEAHNSNNVNSKPNLYVRSLLDKYDIKYTIEFSIEKYVFDFKVGDILIEVNPHATHNVNWSPYKNVKIDKDYHQLKTNVGKNAGYKVVNLWDWDDAEKVIKSFTNKTTIYARECNIKKVSKKDAKIFLNEYHFQGNCNNQKYIYGLYHNDILIQIMSFGKPRYNKNYEYELLRLCTKFGYNVIGGSQKLFKHFILDCNPNSIISYCDDSKFIGKVYETLGFKLKNKPAPSKHWYKFKGNIHITDNLLRQKGYDKLFGTSYGKGTSNRELMLENNFVEIYDAGQSTWIWEL